VGGSTKTSSKGFQSGVSTTTPWEPARPGLEALTNQATGLIGGSGVNPTESYALDRLTQNANMGNPFTGQIEGLANTLLGGGGPDRTGMVTGALGDYNAQDRSGMIGDAYSQYQQRLDPFASGQNVGQNSGLLPYLNVIGNDVQKRINDMFAGAGRDLSGLNQQTLARGIAEGTAPVIANQYNQDIANQLNAAGSLYGAGNTTGGLLAGLDQSRLSNNLGAAGMLSGLDQTRLGNMQAGIGAAQSALQARDSGANQLLAIEAQRRGIPFQNLAQAESLILPIAQGFGTTNSQTASTGTQEQQVPIGQQLLGGLVGGAGLLGGLGKAGAFGPTGWLFSGGGGLLNSLAR